MEPNYWDLGRWGRIPVSMHWTVLLMAAWLFVITWDVLSTLIASAAFFALLVAHEFGHVAVLRRLGIPVEGIVLYGIHGRTSYGYAKPDHEILIAWGGVAANLAILALAWVLALTLDLSGRPVLALVAGPVLLVLAKLNVLLIVLALLPIGPFDGHIAWRAIPRLRAALKRRKRATNVVELTAQRRRELEQKAAREAAELLDRLAKKSDERKDV